jgi:hypothetical protein
MLQPVVGEVSELLGIKHNPYKAYMAARDKYLTRQVNRKHVLCFKKSFEVKQVLKREGRVTWYIKKRGGSAG